MEKAHDTDLFFLFELTERRYFEHFDVYKDYIMYMGLV